MWYIVNVKGTRHYLRPHKEVTFGRKKADIILAEDDSISRLHASMLVKSKDVIKEDETISTCTIKDLDSKYGVYIVGKVQIRVSQEGYKLKHRDKIQFGLQKHVFMVVYVPIIVVTSTLSSNERSHLENLMSKIDGMISNSWTNSCTHLTASRAALTEKVTCALASAVPIVTMEYWENVKLAMEKGTALPDISDFVPLVEESLLSKRNFLLNPNEKRQTVFKNLIFVYFSLDQYRMYGKIIYSAGGKSVFYSNRPLTTKELCAPNVIVIQYPDINVSQSTQGIAQKYDLIYKALQKSKRKMIPETEIPLAIWFCSTEKYCNPKFSFAGFLKRTQSNCPTSEVLVGDTQDESENMKILPTVVSNVVLNMNLSMQSSSEKACIIPETCDDFYAQGTSKGNSTVKSGVQSKICQPKIIKETEDTFGDTALSQESQQITEITSTKNNVYIPETNDSDFTNEISKNTESFIRNIKNTQTQQQVETQEAEALKESMVVNKGTPFNDIASTVNENSRLENADSDTDNGPHRITMKISTPNRKEEINLAAEPKAKTPEKYNGNSEIMLETAEENKRKASSPKQSDSGEDLFVSNKRIRLESLSNEDALESYGASSSSSMDASESSSSSVRESSTFLRETVNRSKFKKVYNKIPKQRITLKDMYIWNTCSTEGVE